MPSYRLNEVFGVYPVPPHTTYINRAGLDERIRLFLDAKQHLVIHGSSKQGKSVLRKHAIADNKCIIVRCSYDTTRADVYKNILTQLDVSFVTSQESGDGRSLSTGAQGEVGINFLGMGGGKARLKGDVATSHTTKTTTRPVGDNEVSLLLVTKHIKNSQRRVVIEDFHYMPENEKSVLCGDLKALFDDEVPFILIGAWEQPNLLPSYNGELTGRFEELAVRWKDDELRELLRLGQLALNIRFSPEILNEMVRDASGNVGLLQRIAARLCLEIGCYETVSGHAKEVDNIAHLETARAHICAQVAERYANFGQSVSNGFANSNAAKKVYMRIVQVCIDATDSELLAGLSQQIIESRVNALDVSITSRNVKEALQKMDKLQLVNQIYPVVATFNRVRKVLHLADNELLFYRKYGNPEWPWEVEDNG